jgi:hypothetical protein
VTEVEGVEDIEEKQKKCKRISVQKWEEKTHHQGVSDERRSVAPVALGNFCLVAFPALAGWANMRRASGTGTGLKRTTCQES